MKKKLTRDAFLKATKGWAHDEEIHGASGATLFWKIGGKTYTEYQPDIGSCEWAVFS